ncbi:MAG: RluA family pseudouridine synthase [Acholeplasmatales bacterium]|nr:RluA family pseudouridine synthase [Acholeplasmatales bacterium]
MEKKQMPKEYEGQRLDKALSLILSNKSRTNILKMIENGDILVNDMKQKASYKIKEGDIVLINDVEIKPLGIEKENLNLDIVYEDDDVLVVNKPKGMVVHPGAGNNTGTLVNGLLYEVDDLAGINGVERPGIVHRIDKDTTGLLMVAKNDEASLALTEQLSKHECKRTYVALVYGEIKENRGVINAPIARSPIDRQKQAVVKNGREAITHFTVLKRYKGFTLIECRLETGRTHQIRVHMEYIGHPLVGDKKYGRRKIIGDQGQFLHAKTLGFIQPKTKKYLEFDSELPKYFTDFLETLEEIKKAD